MQNSVNHRTFERNWRFQALPGSMSLRVAPPPAWARARLARVRARPWPPHVACPLVTRDAPAQGASACRKGTRGPARRGRADVLVSGSSHGRAFARGCASLVASVGISRPSLGAALSGALALASADQRVRCRVSARPAAFLTHRHRMRQGYPLNLSISLSGGEETNQDAPSNGE